MRAHVVWFALLALAAPVRAQDPQSDRAKAQYLKAQSAYEHGDYREALRRFEAAYGEKPVPALLFNIGQCHRNLHDYDAAIFSYRKYLSLLPDAPNKAEVEDLIRDLEDAQAREQAEHDQRETDRARAATAEEPEGRPIYTKWWLWTGVGVVAAGTATFFLTRDRGVPSTDLGNVAFPK